MENIDINTDTYTLIPDQYFLTFILQTKAPVLVSRNECDAGVGYKAITTEAYREVLNFDSQPL